jgi:predicted RNase H-like HicB family nuclease
MISKTITIKFDQDEEGTYSAWIPGETDAYGEGSTPIEAFKMLADELADGNGYEQHFNELVDPEAFEEQDGEKEENEE